MKYFSRIVRLMRINFVLMRYNLDEIILAMPWFTPFNFIKYLNPYYWVGNYKLSRGERIRLALQELGPIFVKVGQIVSTRGDLLPEDILKELSKLQDRVPSFPGDIAKQLIEESLGKPLSSVFLDFNMTALASASIAQVHAATLFDGKEVAVKILRPNIHQIIERDLDLLDILARSAEKYWKLSRRFKPIQIVAEIAQTLHDELDLLREGANASQLRRNFLNSPLLYIPKIYWELSRENVLVMERIYGIPVHDVEALHAAGINMKKLVERGIEVFYTQVLRDNFFHADMHPGNIFVAFDNPENPKFIAVDFGIVGSLNAHDKRYIAENLLAFFKRDYHRVAELYVASGWLSSDTRVDQFEAAIRAACEPIFEQPLKDISFGHLMLRLFQVGRRFDFNIQPQLVLLQKTLMSIEGIGRQLYPDLDLWQTAAPVIERWVKQQLGLGAFVRRIRENVTEWSDKLPEIPGLVYYVLAEKRREQKEAAEYAKMSLQTTSSKPKRSMRRSFLFGVGLGFLISGAIMVSQPIPSYLAYTLAGIGLLSLLTAAI